MEQNDLSKNEFIREKIKNKPVNKKRTLMKLAGSAACGLVFAGVACLVFALALPHIVKQMPDDGQGADSQKLETESTQDDVIPEQPPQQDDTVTGDAVPEEGDVQTGITLEDYQELQNQLYTIGNVANKSIVTVTSVVDDIDIFNNPYETQGQGSGVIIADNDSEYLILTEQKVIQKAKEIRVTFINDSIAPATLQKSDYNTGLTVLSVDKDSLSNATKNVIATATFGNSNMVQNGAMVIALGSPLGTNYSILTGNITSKDNTITTEDHNYSVFTTDILASENGSGILINVQGEIVGIIMQEYSVTVSPNTLTAVALSELTPVIDMLCSGLDIPYIGLHVSTVTEKIADTYNIPKGVYIRSVSMDSPAMEAGLQSGDVIVKIAGSKVSTESAYSSRLLELTPEDAVEITVKRRGANGYSDVTFDVQVGVLQ